MDCLGDRQGDLAGVEVHGVGLVAVLAFGNRKPVAQGQNDALGRVAVRRILQGQPDGVAGVEYNVVRRVCVL